MRALYIAIFGLFSLSGLYLLSINKDTNTMPDIKNEQEKPIVLIKTNLGNIKVELYPDKSPNTVKNFLQYVTDGHYSKTIFHRVIDGFMIQGGGFTQDLNQKKTGKGIKNEANNGLLNKRGTIAMARTQDVDSATAQFYINVVDNPFLDFKSKAPHEFGYCVFGKVVEGMDIVDKIKSVETQNQGPYKDLPVKPIEIQSIEKIG